MHRNESHTAPATSTPSAGTAHIVVAGAGIGGLAAARGLQARGVPVTVYERDASRYARRQGGMLDLPVPTGQAALRGLGLYERFEALARREGQELRVLDPATLELLHHEVPVAAEAASSAPEIDRGDLRDLLLDSLVPGTVQWGRSVAAASPLPDGRARLHLTDGTGVDADLVIGADGAWSRVRPAVSAAVPRYLGTTIVESFIDDVDTHHPGLARLVGPGTLSAGRAGRKLFAQRNSGGHVRVYAMLDGPADWHAAAGLDLTDTEAVRAHLLALFEGWHDDLRALIAAADAEFVNRPLHALPAGHAWRHVPGITLLGDAAHVMPPFGIGANLALLDGSDLAEAVAAHAEPGEGVRAYEARMLPRATAAAKECEVLTAETASGAPMDVEQMRMRLNGRVREAEAMGADGR